MRYYNMRYYNMIDRGLVYPTESSGMKHFNIKSGARIVSSAQIRSSLLAIRSGLWDMMEIWGV